MRNHFRFAIFDFGLGRQSKIQNPKSKIEKAVFRRLAFTLTELLIVMTIIALLAGLGLSAFSGAVEMAREQRTRSMITKIDQLIMERYEGYRTRAVPIKMPTGTTPRLAAMMRLNALRDLMRMEMPDRKSDVVDPPCDYFWSGTNRAYMSSPALQKNYQRLVLRNVGSAAAWTETLQGAECLYLILSTMRDGDKSALDFFFAEEIGDVDGDGMKEILDGWGNPIEFLRWPAGYAEQPGPDGAWGKAGVDDDGDGVTDNLSEAGAPGSDDILVQTMQTKNYLKAPDPFDPVKVHAGTAFPSGPPTLFGIGFTPGYLLHPLIMSAGRDKALDIVTDNIPAVPGNFRYSPAGLPLTADENYPNPYALVTVNLSGTTSAVPIGTIGDTNNDGFLNYSDNITNHAPGP